MFATKDPLLQGGTLKCPPVPFRTSLPVPAIFSQTEEQAHKCMPHHLTAPQRPVVIPRGTVVIPRPEGREICFSSAREQNAPPVPPAHRVAHSLPHTKNITPAFPVTSTAPARSSAPE